MLKILAKLFANNLSILANFFSKLRPVNASLTSIRVQFNDISSSVLKIQAALLGDERLCCNLWNRPHSGFEKAF